MGFDVNDIARLGPGARSQIMEQLLEQHAAPSPAKKTSKYGNRKTEANGITFDSQKEADRYRELMLLRSTGQIRNLRLQQEFVLQPTYLLPDGTRVRAIKYVADFTYDEEQAVTAVADQEGTPGGAVSITSNVWMPVVEDVKSEATRKNRVYRMKKKMMQERFGITIREV